MKEIANESFNILKRVIILVAIFLIIIIGCIICKYTVMQQIQDIDEAVYLFFKEFLVSEPIT